MNLNKIQLAGMLVMLMLFSANLPKGFAQQKKTSVDKAELARLRAVVESNPNDLKAHESFIKAFDISSPELLVQYDLWIKKYPKSAVVPFAIGDRFTTYEDPKAKSYLLKALAIDSNFAEAWSKLALDAERRGEFLASREYSARAVNAAPKNPDYLSIYALSYKSVDKQKFKALSLQMIERFPDSERAALLLYWLAFESNNMDERIKYYEWMRRSYPVNKFTWTGYGMNEYFNLLLDLEPEKAVALAEEMAANENRLWVDRVNQGRDVVSARKLIEQRKGMDALTVLNAIKLTRNDAFSKRLYLLKAEANDVAGKTVVAYDSLMVAFAKAPDMKLKVGLGLYGKKLGKSEAEVERDIWKQIDAVSKAATPFTLKNYFTSDNTSLSDYRGKVVLLTYWFPGCGPCRAEFPHFENVVRKFKAEDLAYVGINIVSAQNGFVIPFLKASGYSFIPLEDVLERDKGNLDNRRLAPMNFLIDQEGRVVFSYFRTEANNEEELELMIRLLLDKKTN